MPKEESIEDLARSAGRLRDRLLKISLSNRQTAKNAPAPTKPKPAPKPKPTPPPTKPVTKAKHPIPPQLKPYLYKKQRGR